MTAHQGSPIDLPETIVREGLTHKAALKLANHVKIVDIAIDEGFSLETITIVTKEGNCRRFGGDGTDLSAQTDEEKAAPRYQLKNVRVLNEDALEIVVKNNTDDDRLFQGVLYVVNAPIPGQPTTRSPLAAARAGAPLAAPQPKAQPAPVRQMPAPASAKLTPRTLVPRNIQPGPNQLVVLLSRRQAELVLRFAQGKFVAPGERQELFGPMRRALHMITEEEYNAELEMNGGGDESALEAGV